VPLDGPPADDRAARHRAMSDGYPVLMCVYQLMVTDGHRYRTSSV